MTPEEKEVLRHAILEALYKNQLHGLSVGGIRLRLQSDNSVATPEEKAIAEELAMLEGLNFVRKEKSPLGIGISFLLSSEGILFCERNGLT
jgi:hypothetical protein